MIFLRMGARLLFLRTKEIEGLREYIVNNLNGIVYNDFERCLEESTEDSTNIFITDTGYEKTDLDDAEYNILVNQPSSIILASILSDNFSGLIHKVDLGPACLIMRISGDEIKVLDKLQETYDGQLVTWRDGIREGEMMDTLLALTNKPLGIKIDTVDLFNSVLLISHPVNHVQKRLRTEGIVFITQSMESGEWYELRVNIYDSYGNYSQHYKRLMLVLNSLELGMVLGETWTRDHALLLYSVVAYQVRLFTLYSPEKIKRMLIGLEYSVDGNRLVDFDLYYRNKKVSWRDIGEKKIKKVEQGKKYREELLNKLTNTVKDQLSTYGKKH